MNEVVKKYFLKGSPMFGAWFMMWFSLSIFFIPFLTFAFEIEDCSSFYNSDYSCDNVLDGNYTTNWATDGETKDFHITFDFLNKKTFDSFNWLGRHRFDERPLSMTILGSDDNISYVKIETVTDNFSFANNLTYEFLEKPSFRYLKFLALNSQGPNPGASDIFFLYNDYVEFSPTDLPENVFKHTTGDLEVSSIEPLTFIAFFIALFAPTFTVIYFLAWIYKKFI